MKLVNPIGRSVQQVGSGTIEPRGCVCNSQLNNKTAGRNIYGDCIHCTASCIGTANKEANLKAAKKINKY